MNQRLTRFWQRPKKDSRDTRRSGIWYCTMEGLFANAFMVLTDAPALTQFAVILMADNSVVAFIGALPFGMRAAQLIGAYFVERFGQRKKQSIIYGSINRAMWIPFILLYLFFEGNPEKMIPLFALVVFLSQLGLNMLGVSWMSWFSDLVPARLRSTYLGFRLSLMAVVNLSVTLSMGLFIDHFKQDNTPGAEGMGYIVILGFGSLCGITTLYLFYRQYEPPFQPAEGQLGFRKDVWLPLRDRRFRPILQFICLWHIALGISGVFFTVYMLTVLHFSYTQVSFYFIIITIGRVLFNPLWGKISKSVGAAQALKLAAVVKIFEPLLWLSATPDFPFPVWLDAVLSAVTVTGFDLALMDVQFAESGSKGKSYYFAWCGILGGLGFFFASNLGGALVEHVKMGEYHIGWMHIHGYHWLFILSSFARALALFFFRQQWRGMSNRDRMGHPYPLLLKRSL